MYRSLAFLTDRDTAAIVHEPRSATSEPDGTLHVRDSPYRTLSNLERAEAAAGEDVGSTRLPPCRNTRLQAFPLRHRYIARRRCERPLCARIESVLRGPRLPRWPYHRPTLPKSCSVGGSCIASWPPLNNEGRGERNVGRVRTSAEYLTAMCFASAPPSRGAIAF